MSTFGPTKNLKSPDRNKQFISNIPRISIYAIFNDQSFNDTLTKDIISFEQGSLKDSYIPRRRMTMERALDCDLDLEPALLSYGFCTSSH